MVIFPIFGVANGDFPWLGFSDSVFLNANEGM